MDIRNIQTFVRVAELESFTKAAYEMNYVQSTVTMQIQQLERELGFPLFDRIGRKISLTPLGKEFLLYANDILHTMKMVNTLGKAPEDVKGTLRVGVLESLLYSTMLKVLPAFKRRYKNVDVQLKMGQAADLLSHLKQNQLDLVYISGNLNTDPDLICCYKRPEKLIFVTSPDDELAGRYKVPLDELLEHPLIVTEHSGICYGRLFELAAAQGLALHHSLTVDSTIAIAELLQQGLGISFLPEYSVGKQLESGQLVKIDVEMEPQLYYSQIFRHKNKWNASFMEGFIALVEEVRPCTSPEEGNVLRSHTAAFQAGREKE